MSKVTPTGNGSNVVFAAMMARAGQTVARPVQAAPTPAASKPAAPQ